MIWFLSFLFVFIFLCSCSVFVFIILAKTWITALNESGQNRHTYFIPNLGGNVFSFPLLNITLTVNLWYKAFILFRTYSFYSWLRQGFYHKEMLNFIKGNCWIYWDHHEISVHNSFHVLTTHQYYTCWFVNIEPCLHLRGEVNLDGC